MKEKMSYNDQSNDELKALYRDLSGEIFKLKCELNVTRKLEKPHLLKQKKRERARVLTALHQSDRIKT